jgi:hypothetical protein
MLGNYIQLVFDARVILALYDLCVKSDAKQQCVPASLICGSPPVLLPLLASAAERFAIRIIRGMTPLCYRLDARAADNQSPAPIDNGLMLHIHTYIICGSSSFRQSLALLKSSELSYHIYFTASSDANSSGIMVRLPCSVVLCLLDVLATNWSNRRLQR